MHCFTLLIKMKFQRRKQKVKCQGYFRKNIPWAVNFEEKEIDFNIKDRLILFTDGITEAEVNLKNIMVLIDLKGVVME